MRSIGFHRSSLGMALILVLLLSTVVIAGWGNVRYGGYGRSAIGEALATLMGMLALIMIPYGILQCYFGYKLFKIILGVIGFISGALIGAVIAAGAGGEQGVVVLVSLLCGVGGAYLSIALYFVGVFLVGAGAGAALIQILMGGDAETGAIIVGAVIVGMVALFVQKVLIIIATAFSGAYSIIFYIILSADRVSPNLMIGLFLVLFITGMLVQFKVTAKNLPDSVKQQLGKENPSEVGTAEQIPPATSE